MQFKKLKECTHLKNSYDISNQKWNSLDTWKLFVMECTKIMHSVMGLPPMHSTNQSRKTRRCSLGKSLSIPWATPRTATFINSGINPWDSSDRGKSCLEDPEAALFVQRTPKGNPKDRLTGVFRDDHSNKQKKYSSYCHSKKKISWQLMTWIFFWTFIKVQRCQMHVKEMNFFFYQFPGWRVLRTQEFFKKYVFFDHFL